MKELEGQCPIDGCIGLSPAPSSSDGLLADISVVSLRDGHILHDNLPFDAQPLCLAHPTLPRLALDVKFEYDRSQYVSVASFEEKSVYWYKPQLLGKRAPSSRR